MIVLLDSKLDQYVFSLESVLILQCLQADEITIACIGQLQNLKHRKISVKMQNEVRITLSKM